MQRLDIDRITEGKLYLDAKLYPVEIRKSERKTHGITITPDRDIIFRTPVTSNEEQLIAFAKGKRRWIIKNLTQIEEYHPKRTERRYESGETFLYLGKEYRLRIVESTHYKVSLGSMYITVSTVNRMDKRRIQRQLDTWYRNEAVKIFIERADALRNEYEKKMGYWCELSGVQKMKSKWGIFYQETGSFKLNTLLVQAPIRSIDYVILHEVLHNKYLNHTPGFFREMEKLMPDWKECKQKMEVMLA